MGSMIELALRPWAHRLRRRVNLPVRLTWGDHGHSGLSLGDFSEPTVRMRVCDAAALPLLMQRQLSSFPLPSSQTR